ncbi:MAG: B12-binding domain-containing radical SAM protein [Synergistetes bacterium]|nr:B12-binding domain-containing radical SAM protein [Synergistota bacterium]MDW8192039.1 radical SAM protein [Synergistota bacterium]
MLWEWRSEVSKYKEKERWLRSLWKPQGDLKWALVYPNFYGVGISNLGFLLIYGILVEDKDIFVSRFFKWDGFPPLSLEEGRSLNEFDIITFSLSYELDLINVVSILKAAGIPPLREDRREEKSPLIGVGGIFPTMNPFPLFPIADFIVCGEGEEVIKEISNVLKASIGKKKESILRDLADLEGVLVPDIKEFTARRWIKDLNSYFLVAPLYTPLNQFGGALLVELSRGCNRSCLFCPVRQCYKPFRFVSLDSIKRSLEDVPKDVKLGLISSVASDHPFFDDLLNYLLEEGRKVSFGSFRVEGISEKLLMLLKSSEQKIITLAPETGSEELRKRIGKDFSNELIEEKLSLVYKFGFKKVKLYFMIGLPMEEISDVESIVKMISKFRGSFKGLEMVININPFVPKPFTPFEEEPFLPIGEIRKRLKVLARIEGAELRTDGLKVAQLEALIARGGVEVGKALCLLGDKLSMKDLRKYIDVDAYLHGRFGKPWRDVIKS